MTQVPVMEYVDFGDSRGTRGARAAAAVNGDPAYDNLAGVKNGSKHGQRVSANNSSSTASGDHTYDNVASVKRSACVTQLPSFYTQKRNSTTTTGPAINDDKPRLHGFTHGDAGTHSSCTSGSHLGGRTGDYSAACGGPQAGTDSGKKPTGGQ